ncbi:unnamed protein product [Peniophora sp. CBMAI 1063]|nr:unnamed protein product [Peniophora sp. CBMAI 1063]
MAKKKGRRNNGSSSSSFNARAKAQREKAHREFYDDDDYSDDEYYYCPQHNCYHHRHQYTNYAPRRDDHGFRPQSEEPEPEPEPEHDHSKGIHLCPQCHDRAAHLLGLLELHDTKWLDDCLFALNWSIYGGLVSAAVLYRPFHLARDSDAHWLIRWPWIISWHCMVVSFLVGLILKSYFIKPFKRIVYDNKLSRALSDTIELRHKLSTQLDHYNVRKLCWGVLRLFILGTTLAGAGIITLVLGRFGTVLHGVWHPVKYITLLPLRLSKWVLRGIGSHSKSVIRLADRVGRMIGRNATKSGTLLLSFAKLYGRTLAGFSRSLVIFAMDLGKLLLLTAVAIASIMVFVLVYNVVRGTSLKGPSAGDPDAAHTTRGLPKNATPRRPLNTPLPAYESLNGDMPTGNPEKKTNLRRKKHKEGVDVTA